MDQDQRNLPSLSALRAFEAAARHLSFTSAAWELCVTQGAISHQVRALEDELGYPLFVRMPRKVELTPEGEKLAQGVTRALGSIVNILRQIEESRGPTCLTVSVPASFAMKWLVMKLELFSKDHPETEVRISATNRLVSPKREGVDLCIRYGPGAYRNVDCELLITEDVFPVCSPQLKLKRLTDLKKHTLLHDSVLAAHADRLSWQRYCDAAGIRVDATAGPSFSHTAMALGAAIAGQGVALGRTCLVVEDIRAGRLKRTLGPTVKSPFSYWLVSPRGGLARPHVAAFVAWLRKTVKADAKSLSA